MKKNITFLHLSTNSMVTIETAHFPHYAPLGDSTVGQKIDHDTSYSQNRVTNDFCRVGALNLKKSDFHYFPTMGSG